MQLSMAPILLLLLLFFSSSTAGGGRRHHQYRIPKPSSSVAPGPAPSPPPSPAIRNACRATRFPTTCESTLTKSTSLPPSPTPSDLILTSSSSASSAVSTALSLTLSILSSSSDPNRTTAARNCVDLLTLSSVRLAQSSSSSSAASASSRAWTSAALLYQYGCWSALKYVNTTAEIASAMAFLVDLQTLTSNSLSMMASFHRFGSDLALWAPPQTERDGFWDDEAGSAEIGSPEISIPGPSEADATVCKDGSCRFDSVQAAVDSVPENRTSGRFVIYIQEGVYEETVRVPYQKKNVVFVGDGMGRTVITGSLNAGMVGVSTYNTATVGVVGDGFMARNLTISNTAGPDAHQAVAFRSDSDLSILESVELSGHQDTLYASSLRQLYKSCVISGTVDFIFGNSASVFDDCLILILPRQLNPDRGESNTVTAHGRTDPAQTTGFVFHNCVVNGSDEYVRLYRQKPGVHRSYLGRPWKEYSRTVFISCYLEEVVRPEGWLPWDGQFALPTLFYGEFGSQGPRANTTARVPWSSQIPAEHVGVYSVENFIQGNEWIPIEK